MDDMKQRMAEQFSRIVQAGLYTDADEMLRELKKTVTADEYISEDLCITAAFLYNRLGKRDEELYYLQCGLMQNPSSAPLFISLADYYSKTNPWQELICLYQAGYLAKRAGNEEQISFVDQIIAALEKNQIKVAKTSIVILSFNTLSCLRQCLDSIKETIPLDLCQVVVVDNASTDGSLDYLRALDWISLVENHENRGFPGGCNDGIEVSEKGNDIWLLDSDTILSENSYFWLKMGLYAAENIGSCGSVTNYAANSQRVEIKANSPEEYVLAGNQMNIPKPYPYVYQPFLIGFSLLLKRRALNKTGLLDESFYPGKGEDIDLELRMLHEGYQNCLCTNSFVFRYGSRSSDKLNGSAEEYKDLVYRNRDKLLSKIGYDPFTFIDEKTEYIEEIKEQKEAALHVLEVGCGIGAAFAVLKTMYPNSVFVGTEVNAAAASMARAYGKVFVSDIDALELPEDYKGYFDYIILGDGLEYSADPKETLVKLSGYLKNEGRILISVSNIRHYSVIIPLLSEGRFTYSEEGIIQKGKRTFFTENEAARLISGNGYFIKKIKPIPGDEPNEQEKKYIREIARLFDQPDTDDFTSKGYIYTAEKMI